MKQKRIEYAGPRFDIGDVVMAKIEGKKRMSIILTKCFLGLKPAYVLRDDASRIWGAVPEPSITRVLK